MRDTIEAPAVQPPRYGIVAAAAAIDDGSRWGQGVQFTPEACGAGGAVRYDCAPGEGELGEAAAHADTLGFDAFEVWAADKCSALGHPDVAARARRALDATRSFQIGKELWGGAITTDRHAADDPDAVEGPSPFLTDGDDSSMGSAAGVKIVAKLDAEFARCSQGRRAMIHLTPWALATAMEDGSGTYLYRDGSLILTQLGSIVVPEAGYGSSATDLAVFITPLVQVRLGPVTVTPSGPDDLVAALDRSDNTLRGYAQQPVLYQFDAECCRLRGTMTT